MNFEDLVWLFRCDMSNRHIIRMDLDEAALLWKAVTESSGPILEIGRFRGGSTVLIAAAAGRKRRIVSVDRSDRLHPACADFLALRSATVELIIGDSRSVELRDRFGLCFIDGDHSFKGVLADARRCWPSLDISGGPLVLFHDAVPCERNGRSSHHEGVRRVTGLLLESGAAEHVASAGSALLLRKKSELPTAIADGTTE